MKRLTPIISLILVAAVPACNSSNASPSHGAPESGNALMIETAAGDLAFEPRNVENGECSSDDCVDFKRVDQAPADYALVQRSYYEGSEWLLIDTTSGEQQTFSSQPNFDPSGQRAIVANPDETGDGSGSGSFVYERADDGEYSQVARFEMDEFVPAEFVGWAGSDCANMRGYTGWGKPGFDTAATKDASIARSLDGSWAISLNTCPDVQ